MIVDYNNFTECLLKTLSERYNNNYFTVEDVKTTLNDIKDNISKPFEITDELKSIIDKMSPQKLLTEITKYTHIITDTWDRDNLTMLKYMCCIYEHKVNCYRFQDFIRMYDITQHKITSCRYGHSLSLYGCFMSIIETKTNKNVCVISNSIIEQNYNGKEKNFKLIYDDKIPIDKILATIIRNETGDNTCLTKDQIDHIKYILAEPDSVTIEKATS